MVEAIKTSSQLIMCYANDLVDNSLIEHGKLVPHSEFGSPVQAILEVVKIVRNDFESKKLHIKLKIELIFGWYMEFDQ